MLDKKYFGTDGIRGKVGEFPINPEFVLKLGWAAGMVLGKGSRVLIGKDTRISGYLIESLLEAGLSSAGVMTNLLGPMPTPAVAYLTRTFNAEAGIVISASHNPYYDNGIKFFSTLGTKFSSELEIAIEEQLGQPLRMVNAADLGKAKRLDDAAGRYIEFCKSTLGLNRNLNGMKIVLDCANGATYHIAPAVFSELKAEVIELGTAPDGFNINHNCGSIHPELLAKIVCAENADLGIAFDGDGDRVIMVDHHGEIVSGDELLFIMAKYRWKTSGIIGTLMSNLGLELSLKQLGIDFKRTKVGDRYVMEALKENNWILGGEPSGHIVNLALTSTGDGIVSALQVLSVICDTGQNLATLKSEMLKFPQVLINVAAGQRGLEKHPKVLQAVTEAETVLGNSGRVLLRASGTEPLIRIMVEGEDVKQVKTLAQMLAETVKRCS